MVWVVFISPFWMDKRTSGMDCKSGATRNTAQFNVDVLQTQEWLGQKKGPGRNAWSGINQVLEVELQGELYQTSLSVTDRTGHNPEVGVVGRAAGAIWRSELRMVKEVKELS